MKAGKSLELYKATGQYGPPDELNMDIGDTRALFKAGRCGLIVEWGDPGTLQLDDDAKSIRGKMYAISAVGSTEVLDRATGKLVPVSAATAPMLLTASTMRRLQPLADGQEQSIKGLTQRRKLQLTHSCLT